MLSGKAATLGHAAVITVLLAASITAQTGDPDTCAPFVLSSGVLTCSASGSMRQQLRTATFIAGSAATGETIAQAIALEVATAPIGSSSGGFIHSFDVRTRRTSRTSATFGPSYAERGLTIGRGRFSAGASFASRTYDSIDGLDLDDLPTFRFVGGTLPITASSMNIEATTQTLALFGHYGVWDNFDVGVMVPLVNVSVTGASHIFDQSARELQRVGFDGSSSGLGDIAVFGKYRFFHVGQPASMDAPPNGDLAAMATLRLPSGNSEDMLGLGVTRVAVTFIGSATIHRLAPHINVGYEFWSDSIGHTA